jgi:hypothetical protein
MIDKLGTNQLALIVMHECTSINGSNIVKEVKHSLYARNNICRGSDKERDIYS